MKKTKTTILLLIFVLAIGIYIFISITGKDIIQKIDKGQDKEVVEMEEEFNNSGRAKAIEDETDLWQVYDNPDIGISFNYPHGIILLEESDYNQDKQKSYLKVELKDIGVKEGPLDLSIEDEQKNIEELSAGNFGMEYDFPFPPSKKVKTVGFLFAQDFMVLSRFEICNVTLERKLLFYFNNKQIILTSYAPVDKLEESMSDYFTIDKENCGKEKMWNQNKLEDFYKTLVAGNAPAEIQNWFNDFEQISETIIFTHR